MSFLDGISERWVLGRSCAVNWDAWSAIGTGFAAIVALFLGAQSQLQQWVATRQRRSLAVKLARSHLSKLFDQMTAIANNPGVVAGRWDERVVHFVQSASDMAVSACKELERCMIDLNREQVERLSDIVADSHVASAAINALDREPMERRVELADYATGRVYDLVISILNREEETFKSLGVELEAQRTLLNRNPR